MANASDDKHPEGKEKSDKAQSHEAKEPVNLRKAFPITFRSIFRRSLHWIIIFFILCLFITVLDHFRPGTGELGERVFFLGCLTALLVGLIFLAAKLVYELIYYHIYYYGVELEHLIISRGVFFKTRASFPLARMADIYLERAPLDMIFFIYNLRVTTHSPIAEHGSIEGLSFRKASDLQNYLLAMVNTTTTPVDEEQVIETLHELKATEDAGILGQSPAVADPPRAAPPPKIEAITQQQQGGKAQGPAPEKKKDTEVASGAEKKSASGQSNPTESLVNGLKEDISRAATDAKSSAPKEIPNEQAPAPHFAEKIPVHLAPIKSGKSGSHGAPWRAEISGEENVSEFYQVQEITPETKRETGNKKSQDENATGSPNSDQQSKMLVEVVTELEKTQEELQATRKELSAAEKVLDRARDAIERAH